MTDGAGRPGVHLKAAAIAAPLLAVALIALHTAALPVARDLAGRTAGDLYPNKSRGTLLQRAACRRGDIVLLHGSSELLRAVPGRPSDVFASFPTGFAVMPMGDRGTPLLVTMQQIASLGDAARGCRLAISLSPTAFVLPDTQTWEIHDPYLASQSHLQALTSLTEPRLPDAIRREQAQLMLRHRRPLADDPILQLAAWGWAGASRGRSLLAKSLEPVLRAEAGLLQLADDALVTYRAAVVPRSPRPSRPPPTWAALGESADRWVARHRQDNPFGIDTRPSSPLLRYRGTVNDSAFASRLRAAPAWRELDLVLATLRALDARPLVVGMPLNGRFQDFLGNSAVTRQQYYERVADHCHAAGIPCLIFREHEYEPGFLADHSSHFGPRGWLAVDRVLEAFAHDSSS
jgi:D-alanine transfer protein